MKGAAEGPLFAPRVLLFAAAVPWRLRTRKLADLQGWLEPAGPLPPAPGRAALEALARRVDRLLRRGRPLVRSGCLTRGLTLYRFLRLAGADVSLRFGMGRVGDGFSGHCWVVLDGEPFAEPRDPRLTFTETWRIEPPGSRAAEPPGCASALEATLAGGVPSAGGLHAH